jgi:hypothetical protein
MNIERMEDVRREGKTAARTWGIVSPGKRVSSCVKVGIFGNRRAGRRNKCWEGGREYQ